MLLKKLDLVLFSTHFCKRTAASKTTASYCDPRAPYIFRPEANKARNDENRKYFSGEHLQQNDLSPAAQAVLLMFYSHFLRQEHYASVQDGTRTFAASRGPALKARACSGYKLAIIFLTEHDSKAGFPLPCFSDFPFQAGGGESNSMNRSNNGMMIFLAELIGVDHGTVLDATTTPPP